MGNAWMHRSPLQKVQTAPMIKSYQNQSGRRSSFAEGGGLFYRRPARGVENARSSSRNVSRSNLTTRPKRMHDMDFEDSQLAMVRGQT